MSSLLSFDTSSWFLIVAPNGCSAAQFIPGSVNAVSSLVYVVSALFTWTLSHADFSLLGFVFSGKLLAVMMTLVGFSGFLLHMELWQIAAHFEVFSGILISYMGAFMLIDITISWMLQSLPRFLRHKLSIMNALVIFTLLVFSVSVWFLPGTRPSNLLPILLLMPQVCTLCCIAVFNFAYCNACVDVSNRFNQRAIRLMNGAAVALMLAGVIPLYLEPVCVSDSASWQRKFLYMHAVWHVLSAYGIHCLLHTFSYFQLALSGQDAVCITTIVNLYQSSSLLYQYFFGYSSKNILTRALFLVVPFTVTRLEDADDCGCWCIQPDFDVEPTDPPRDIALSADIDTVASRGDGGGANGGDAKSNARKADQASPAISLKLGRPSAANAAISASSNSQSHLIDVALSETQQKLNGAAQSVSAKLAQSKIANPRSQSARSQLVDSAGSGNREPVSVQPRRLSQQRHQRHSASPSVDDTRSVFSQQPSTQQRQHRQHHSPHDQNFERPVGLHNTVGRYSNQHTRSSSLPPAELQPTRAPSSSGHRGDRSHHTRHESHEQQRVPSASLIRRNHTDSVAIHSQSSIPMMPPMSVPYGHPHPGHMRGVSGSSAQESYERNPQPNVKSGSPPQSRGGEVRLQQSHSTQSLQHLPQPQARYSALQRSSTSQRS